MKRLTEQEWAMLAFLVCLVAGIIIVLVMT